MVKRSVAVGRGLAAVSVALGMVLFGVVASGCKGVSNPDPPSIQISTDLLVFQQEESGLQRSLRVTNVGEGDLLFTGRVTRGGTAFTTNLRGEQRLARDESMVVQVTFDPSIRITQGELVISSNDPERGTVNVLLTVDDASPQLAVSADPVRFGIVPPGQQQRRTVNVLNIGNAPLEVLDIELSQSADDLQLGEGVLASLPATLQPFSDTLPIDILCVPSSDREVYAELIISSNDPRYPTGERIVRVECNTAAPCIDVRSDGLSLGTDVPLDFGATPFDFFRTKQVTVANCDPRGGDTPLRVTEISFVPGLENERFELVDETLADLPWEIGFQGERTFEIRYRPERPADYVEGEIRLDETALLFVSNDDAREDLQVPVRGYGSDFVPPVADVRCRVVDGAPPTAPAVSTSTRPFARIACSGAGSSDPNDLPIVEYLWRKQLDGGNWVDIASREVEIRELLDTVGTFRYELRVRNSQGLESDPAVATVFAVPEGDLLCRLTWRHWFGGRTDPVNPSTGGCGADVDLHVVPGYGFFYDNSTHVSYQARNRSWRNGEQASLDIDVLRGVGPENVTVRNPSPGETYRCSAHYYNDRGFGTATATMEVIIGGARYATYTVDMLRTNQWWDAIAVIWDPVSPDVVEVNSLYDNVCGSPFRRANMSGVQCTPGQTSRDQPCW